MARSRFEQVYEKTYREYQEQIEREKRMAAEQIQSAWSLSERITIAVLVTIGVAYAGFLGLDIVNGWGLGWVVLGYIAGAGALVVAVSLLVSVWRWVYKATGKYQMQRGK